MRMYLICLNCQKPYSMSLWAMKRTTYREYSYCDICYIQKEGRKRSLFARLFTRKTRRKQK